MEGGSRRFKSLSNIFAAKFRFLRQLKRNYVCRYVSARRRFQLGEQVRRIHDSRSESFSFVSCSSYIKFLLVLNLNLSYWFIKVTFHVRDMGDKCRSQKSQIYHKRLYKTFTNNPFLWRDNTFGKKIQIYECLEMYTAQNK